ncbi:hypothetical protein D4764_16G0001750 [Takifugu flavidus]|uniref:Uncharacterized protein n=1 Tax=Takifugu flavidus TaxID=433684 RepID=A0A5C6NXW5_9TELE|nr:hypothetical protein D4764_16G0001750 [Takifugu flavidus]
MFMCYSTSKTKELILDFKKARGDTHDPIHINRMAVERVSSFKFLGTHILEDLSWTTNTPASQGHHFQPSLFSLLLSGRRFRTLRTRPSRLKNSFFSRAVSLLNSS